MEVPPQLKAPLVTPSMPLRARRASVRARNLTSLLLVLLLSFTLLGPAPSATAAPAVTGLVTTAGTKQLAFTWSPVQGASSYLTEVSTSSKMKKPRKVTTTAPTSVVKKLKKSGTYYVRITATTASGPVRSKVTKVRTTTASTGRGSITAVEAAGKDTVKISWKRFKTATSLRLRISYDNTPIQKSTKGAYFEITGISPVATSRTVTIPKDFQALIGSASANPAYVQLISYNGSKRSTSPLKYGWPTPVNTNGHTDIRMATYNVTSISATAKLSGRTWADRREAVRRTVLKVQPDVLAAQEATTASATPELRHFEDVEALLDGYRLAYPSSAVGPAGDNATKGAHLYYRPDTVSVIEYGVESAKKVTGGSWGSEIDRHFSWALMEHRRTGNRFYVASVHLQTGSSAFLQGLRTRVGLAIDSFLSARNKNGYPVILAGDLNSNVSTYPKGVTTELIKRGYADTAAAPDRSGYLYSTSNSGFPAKPKSYAYVGTRIDYILMKGGAGSCAAGNQVLLKSGTFDATYYGSDHNLQWADLQLR